MFDLIRFIILGFIQGITEPIPVSSSGHLLIFQKLISDNASNIDFGLLSTITNAGSLIAIMILFKDDIVDLFKDFFGYIKNIKILMSIITTY